MVSAAVAVGEAAVVVGVDPQRVYCGTWFLGNQAFNSYVKCMGV